MRLQERNKVEMIGKSWILGKEKFSIQRSVAARIAFRIEPANGCIDSSPREAEEHAPTRAGSSATRYRLSRARQQSQMIRYALPGKHLIKKAR